MKKIYDVIVISGGLGGMTDDSPEICNLKLDGKLEKEIGFEN